MTKHTMPSVNPQRRWVAAVVSLSVSVLLFCAAAFHTPTQAFGPETDIPPPYFCHDRRLITITGDLHDFEHLICDGIEHYNAGRYDQALTALIEATDMAFLDWPNFEGKGLVAIVYHKLGKVAETDRALDGAYLTVMIAGGHVECDPNIDFRVIPNVFTRPLSAEVIETDGADMCTPIFPSYNSDTVRGRWEYLRWPVEWYELARRLTGRGRPLPGND